MSKWLDYDIIGFDLDGTIYDEFDFISQAYRSVSLVLADALKQDSTLIYKKLCQEWLRYGSSANIFQGVINQYSVQIDYSIISKCIECYRYSDFDLELSKRAECIFDMLKDRGTKLFLVTDGHKELQRNKIEKLGLYRWFCPENIAISGDYGKEMQKPSAFMSEKISVLKQPIGTIAYLGDRKVDQLFARNCKFSYIAIKNMVMIE